MTVSQTAHCSDRYREYPGIYWEGLQLKEYCKGDFCNTLQYLHEPVTEIEIQYVLDQNYLRPNNHCKLFDNQVRSITPSKSILRIYYYYYTKNIVHCHEVVTIKM